MYELRIENMTCGHCVSRVTQAVKSTDSSAKVEIDLGNKQVHIDSGCDFDELADALAEAGYPAVLVSDIR